jgi:hypothetical protein
MWGPYISPRKGRQQLKLLSSKALSCQVQQQLRKLTSFVKPSHEDRLGSAESEHA